MEEWGVMHVTCETVECAGKPGVGEGIWSVYVGWCFSAQSQADSTEEVGYLSIIPFGHMYHPSVLSLLAGCSLTRTCGELVTGSKES